MKVCVTTFGGDGGKSGIGTYIIQLLRQLPAAAPDIEFDVVAFEDEKEQFLAKGGGAMKPLCYGGWLKYPVVNIAWHQLALPRLCARNRYDVLLLPAGNRRLVYSAPCPTVGTFHDFSALHVERKYDPFRMFYILRVLPMLVRRLTRVITISESSRKDLVEFARVPEDRIDVIPLGVDTDHYRPRDKAASAAKVAERYGVRPPYLLFVSRLEHPGKNHVRLIRAFDRWKAAESAPHQLVLVGSDWGRADEIHRAAEACRFKQDIVFTGHVPSASGLVPLEYIPDLYCGSDAFIFPSLYEGFGMPVAEAMACGVPVACSNVSSIPEVGGDAVVLFDPYQEDSIEQAIRVLMSDSALRVQCVRRGLERSKSFGWPMIAARTVDVLRRVGK